MIVLLVPNFDLNYARTVSQTFESTYTEAPNRIAADTMYWVAEVVMGDSTDRDITIYKYNHTTGAPSETQGRVQVDHLANLDMFRLMQIVVFLNKTTSGIWARANGTGANIYPCAFRYNPDSAQWALVSKAVKRTEGTDVLASALPVETDKGEFAFLRPVTMSYDSRIAIKIWSDVNIDAGDIDIGIELAGIGYEV